MSEPASGLPVRLRLVCDMAFDGAGAPLSFRAIDRLAGRPEGHLGMILSGQKPNPTIETIGAYAPVLGFELDWMIEGRGAQPLASTVAAAVRAATAVVGRSVMVDNQSSHTGRNRARAAGAQ